ncbi:FG-GAP repeat domain-containing protein [Cyclobacterium jeungdonense]|uniref:VCBS repeat-containing protein n=1 Tax=Cyclobacterium jeungdonense TaxID=708087 RepID=A0ABT8CBD8_9BACT|nr:VCBS repeat-containing protein [Cyclobacterium jeungdonense]MDN3690114.1 VCBS repeat-containing protein [Cyclobacterium jeungdonense]
MALIRKGLTIGFFISQCSFTVQAQADRLLKGRVLAESYCASCHAYPSPSLLPKGVWKNQVLPQMAALMGDQAAQDSLGVWEDKTEEEIAVQKKLGVYPSFSQVSTDDFQAIIDFYVAEAPNALLPQKTKESPEPLHHFTAKKLFIEGIKSPKTSLVAINEERRELFISDATTNQLYVKDRNDELFTLPSINSPAIHFIKKAPNVYNFITIGSIAPSDLSQGAVYEMDLMANAWNRVIDQLGRPVYGIWEDLEKDGKADFLICNYGHNGGNLSIYRDGDFSSTPIQLGGAGARKIEIGDINRDGKPDIVALFCQGRERVSVFYNKGNGQFDNEQVLLSFSPVMGSSYFELQDLNADGELDLLISNGDNWDYSSVPKPYHGFRIYENRGNGVFEEAWFYPQYGAAKAMALDFDEDGDLDLATIAFYDELENPEQQFLFFENKGKLIFTPKVIPEAALGKWLTMDVGDIDGDGDQDIVLGSYAHNTLEYTKLLIRGIDEVPNVLILENNRYQKE